jgi:ATP-dependent Clp protease ATP-binding subunit ClpB
VLLRSKWEGEKNILDNIQQQKITIENYRLQAEQAERNGDYGKVAEIRYGKIKEAEEALKASEQRIR